MAAVETCVDHFSSTLLSADMSKSEKIVECFVLACDDEVCGSLGRFIGVLIYDLAAVVLEVV